MRADAGVDVLSLFTNAAVRDIGAVAIVALVVLMILTGRLVPKVTHDREIAAANERTKDAVRRGDEWKQGAEDTAKVNAVVRQQNTDLIESQKVFEQFLRAAGPSFGDTQPGGA